MQITKLKLFLLSNIIFLFYSLHYLIPMPKPVLSLAINFIIFFVPGISGIYFFRKKIEEIIPFVFLIICISLVALLSGCLFFYITKIKLSSMSMLIFLVLVSNTGIILSKPRQEIPQINLKKKGLVALFLLSILLYSILFMYASRFVPPLEDQDSETQGTAYGLIHELKPYMVTNRGAIYFFAHPLLLHFYIGNSALLLDELDEISYYYDSALEGKKILDKANAREMLDEIWKSDFQRFEANPHLLATRMSNIFFSVLLFYFLFFFLYRATNSFFLSLAGPVLYFTFPEVFVRSSYGGYMAIENFTLLVIAYLYFFKDKLKIDETYKNVLFLLSGVFGAFASQKIVIVVIAMAIYDFISHEGNLWAKVRSALNNKIIQGVILGTILFCGYGFLVDSRVLIDDYLKGHIAARFLLNDVRFTHSSAIWYPSIIELWKEFNRHLGIPFLLVAVPLSIYTLFRIKSKESFFGLWFIAGAIAFSITDWRQTKHLMLIILPLIIFMILFVSRSQQWVKVVFCIMLIFLVFNNIEVIINIANDFSTISPTPMW
jgi:hypothetical protein